MAKKFEKIGNYLIISDTVSSAIELEVPTKEVQYINDSGVISFDTLRENLKQQNAYTLALTAGSGTVTLDSGESDKATGTITCASVVGLDAATGTAQLASALAATAATGTITCASAVANTFSTGTITCASVLADTASTGTITCASVDVLTKASGTIQCTTVLAGDAVTVNGLVYTGVAGVKANDTEFSVDTGDTACALDLADSINNDGRVGTLNDLTAISLGDTVIATQTVGGVGGNATAMSTVAGTFTLSGATFTGGLDADTVTVNGLTYTAVTGVKADNTEFSTDTSDDATATDLALSITNDARVGTLNDVTAAAVGAVVTCTQTVVGTGGDATTLVSSDGVTLAVSGATFSGGVDADTVTVNGLLYTAVTGAKADNTEFSVDTGDNACAADLADSITNDSRVGTLGDLTASAVATNVCTITTDVAGVAGDAVTLVSSDGVTLAVSGATFSGGVDRNWVIVNGLTYTAVAGVKSDNTEFSIDTSDIACATDLADSITNDVRVGTLNDVTAASGGTDTVTCTQTVIGAAGNATDLSSSGATLAVSGAAFTSGTDPDTVTVNGLVYSAVDGVKSDNTEFSVDTSDIAAATDLADSITNDTRTGTLNDVTASSGGTDTVTCTQSVRGAGGNATTLAENTAGLRVTLSGATFTGGTDSDTVTVNGLLYSGVVGAKADNTEFSVDTSDIACATDLADSITNDARVGTLNDVTAANGGTAVVTCTTSIGGTVGNATTLVSSDGVTLAVSGATFTGGLDNALVSSIEVDSVEIMSGTEIFVTDLATTATNIAANITAHTSVPNYNATALGAVITIVPEQLGAVTNGFVVDTTEAVLSTTDVNLSGGSGNIVDSLGIPFDDLDALVLFLRTNTGA